MLTQFSKCNPEFPLERIALMGIITEFRPTLFVLQDMRGKQTRSSTTVAKGFNIFINHDSLNAWLETAPEKLVKILWKNFEWLDVDCPLEESLFLLTSIYHFVGVQYPGDDASFFWYLSKIFGIPGQDVKLTGTKSISERMSSFLH